MKAKHNLSVNILRDEQLGLDYIPTPNTKRIAGQLMSDFESGIRSFNIIGSYGTGKSSFLWALSQDLKGQKNFFGITNFAFPKVEVLPFVSEYMSLRNFLAGKICGDKEEVSNEDIFAELYHRFHRLGKKKGLLVLLIDEFGKFLEYAAKNSPERELYFLQQLAEFVNNPEYNILLITTLHQNFDAYAFSLNNAQRLEWSKVKGRFQEITFNEPVEQLLHLAGEKLSQNVEFVPEKKAVKKMNSLFEGSKSFSINQDLVGKIGLQLFPLDLFSAATVALALQRYGQNERSLFSFLESSGYTSIRGFDTRINPFYNLANVYDYLVFNFYSFLGSKYNPDSASWAGIKNAIERVENSLEGESLRDGVRLVKAMGILNMFSSKGAKLDDDFWGAYAQVSIGIENPEAVLKQLYDRRIILYRKYEHRIILTESSDVDIQSELLLAGNQIGEIRDLAGRLNMYFKFPPLFAKYHYYHTGTPRIFEFVISSNPEVNIQPKADVDGYINIIFNDKISEEDVESVAKANKDKAIVYGYFRNTAVIRDLVWEIEKTKKTKDNISKDDRIAQRELSNIQQHQELLLNHYLLQCMYSPKEYVAWFFGEKEYVANNKRAFNTWLSEVCEVVYSGTPAYKNELVNRSRLSSQIQTAKRSYLRHLVQHWNEENLGFPNDRFPPERTIYMSLLVENGLVPDPSDPFAPISIGQESSFKALWDYCENFLEGAKKHKRPISELLDGLLSAPFKLKQGLIDFWLPTFIFLKRDEIALFSEGVYLPTLGEETLELITKRPKDFTVKKFDVEGVRLEFFNEYRRFLNLSNKESLNNQAYIETIRPFLTFYRQLTDYAKTTNRLQKESVAIRNAISKATDPEKSFFEDFPGAMGVSLKELKKSPEVLATYIDRLQNAIREIRSCYDELVNRFESFITAEVLYSELNFEAYKATLQQRFANIKPHLLLPHHKTLLLRISSELDDRKAWLSSLAQAVVGRSLENLRDEDEPLLYGRFKDLILELDTLNELTQTVTDETSEEVVGVEITSLDNIQKRVVRFPIQKKEEVKALEEVLKANLGKDKSLNIAALVNILKDLTQKT